MFWSSTPRSSTFLPLSCYSLSIPLSCCLHDAFPFPVLIPVFFFDLLLFRSFHPSMVAHRLISHMKKGLAAPSCVFSLWFRCLLPWAGGRVGAKFEAVHQAMTWLSISLPCSQGFHCHLTQHPKLEASEEPATRTSAPIFEFFLLLLFSAPVSQHTFQGGPAATLLHACSLTRCCWRWGP